MYDTNISDMKLDQMQARDRLANCSREKQFKIFFLIQESAIYGGLVYCHAHLII